MELLSPPCIALVCGVIALVFLAVRASRPGVVLVYHGAAATTIDAAITRLVARRVTVVPLPVRVTRADASDRIDAYIHGRELSTFENTAITHIMMELYGESVISPRLFDHGADFEAVIDTYLTQYKKRAGFLRDSPRVVGLVAPGESMEPFTTVSDRHNITMEIVCPTPGRLGDVENI